MTGRVGLLPEPGPAAEVVESAQHEGLAAVGSFAPGGSPLVYSSISQADRSTGYVDIHERAHHGLSANTSYGLFTTLLDRLHRSGHIQRATLEECRRRQWAVQELTATYAELAFVAGGRPDKLAKAVRQLPSALAGKPPYRELFEYIHRWLPLAAGASASEINAAISVLQVMSVAAMNTDCLARLHAFAFRRGGSAQIPTDDELLQCMHLSPKARFETLLETLVESGTLSTLLERARTLSASDSTAKGEALYQLLLSMVPTVLTVEDKQTRRVFDELTECWVELLSAAGAAPPAHVASSVFDLQNKLPAFLPSREEIGKLIASSDFSRLPAEQLRACIEQWQTDGLGIWFALGTIGGVSQIQVRPYYLEDSGLAWPRRSSPLPDNIEPLGGFMLNEELLAVTADYERVPHIVTFYSDGWKYWPDFRDDGRRVFPGIRIIHQVELSLPALQDMLAYERLGEVCSCVVLPLSSMDQQSFYIAGFQSVHHPCTFALVDVPGDQALRTLPALCERLEVESCTLGTDDARRATLFSLVGLLGGTHLLKMQKSGRTTVSLSTQNQLSGAPGILQVLLAPMSEDARAAQEQASVLFPPTWKPRENFHHLFASRLQQADQLSELAFRTGHRDDLHNAMTAYMAAIDVCERDLDLDGWGRAHVGVGHVLWGWGEKESGPNLLQEASVAYERALTAYPRDKQPLPWARTQRRLGIALGTLGRRMPGTRLLKRAVSAFESALEELERDAQRLEWGLVQQDLGLTLQLLGERQQRPDNLLASLVALQRALSVLDWENTPVEWACAQNNIGGALSKLATRERNVQRLDQAIDAYTSALSVLQPSDEPHLWATIQLSLGGACLELGRRTKDRARFEQSSSAFALAAQHFGRLQRARESALASTGLREARDGLQTATGLSTNAADTH